MRHRFVLFVSFLLLALSSLPASGAAGPWEENPESAVRLISSWAEAPRLGQEQPEIGGEILLGLHFTTRPGWHVYWKNSGSAGFPPVVDFSATSEVGEAELLWPAPERYELPGDLVSFGYEGEVVYPVRVSWGEVDREARSVTFTADVDYLVCEVDCIPYRYLLTLEQPLAPAESEPVPAPEESELLTFWQERVPEPVGKVEGLATEARLVTLGPVGPGEAAGSDALRLEVRLTAEAELPEAPELFFEAHEVFEIGTPESEPIEGEGGEGGWIYRVPLSFFTTPDALPEEERFAWTLTGLPVKAGLPHAVEAEAGAPRVAEGTPWGGEGREAGGGADLASALPAAMLAGLAGALTPTVLPLFLALILAARSRAPLLAAAGGVVAAALAAAVGAALAGGTWGAQLQSARWGMIASGVSVVLALNLLGLLPWPLPRSRPSRGTAALSGALAVGLALAWNLPGGGRAFGAALREAGSGEMGAALPAAALVAGLALALPLLAAAFLLPVLTRRFGGASRAEGIEEASDPGFPEVTESSFARTVLAFVALGGTVWLLHGVSALVEPPALAFFQAGLLAMGLLAWLRARVGRGRRAAQILDLAVLVVLAVLVHWLA